MMSVFILGVRVELRIILLVLHDLAILGESQVLGQNPEVCSLLGISTIAPS